MEGTGSDIMNSYWFVCEHLCFDGFDVFLLHLAMYVDKIIK